MRTYLPTLYKVLRFSCAFFTKHRQRILQIIGNEHAQAFDNWMAACDVIVDLMQPFVEPSL